MKKKVSKILVVGCLACHSVGSLQAQTLIIDGTAVEYNYSPISLYVNKQLVQTKVMEPIQLDNRILVPAREVFEAMGATVKWDHTIKEVTIQYKNTTIILVVNQKDATINGQSVPMDVPGKIINDKIMIPIRFVSEGIGMNVEWDSTNRAVWIDEPTSEEENKITTSVKQVITEEKNNEFIATVIASEAMQEAKLTRLQGKVAIDIPNSKSLLSSNISPEANTYIERIRTSQFTADTTRIVLDFKPSVEMNVSISYATDRTKLYIKLTKIGGSSDNAPENDTPVVDNEDNNGSNNNGSNNDIIDETPTSEFYVAGTKPKLNLTDVSAQKIQVTDNYRNRTLIFDLGANYSHILPNTELKPNDANVTSISVKTNGTTKITVVTKKVYTYQLKQSGNTTVVELVRPREKYQQIVVLDIGHGGSDKGAIGNGLTEKEINFNQGMALYKLLEADPNIKVYMTRETDVYPTLQFRSELANDIEADLFISIHNNSAGSTVRGTETLYFPSSTDSRGKEIAQMVQNNIISSCGTNNRGIKPRSDLYVLRTTNMPAILIETGFISNATEAQLINSPSFISKWAQGVYSAVVDGFKLLGR